MKCEKLLNKIEESKMDTSESLDNSLNVTRDESSIAQIRDIIKEKEILINEIMDKNDLLKKHIKQLNINIDLLNDKLHSQVKNNDVLSYSQATMNQTRIADTSETLPSIIVKCKEGVDVTDIYNKTKNILTNKSKIQYNKTLKLKDKIVVKCNNPNDITKTTEILQDLDTTQTIVEIEKKNKPRLKVVNIDVDFGKNENNNILQDIISRNNLEEENDCLEIVYKYFYSNDNKQNQTKNKNNINISRCTIILEVNAYSYAKIMRNKKLYVGSNSCAVYNDYNFNMCNSCSAYGHRAENSKGWKCTHTSCRFCAGKHLSKNCTNEGEPKCINCMKYNEKYNGKRNINHTADDKVHCASYKASLKLHIKKYDYPYCPLPPMDSSPAGSSDI